MTADPITRDTEPSPFTDRFVTSTMPTVRAASLFACADQAEIETWLRELAATTDGLTAIFDLLQCSRAARERFLAMAEMLDIASKRIDTTLVMIGAVKSV